MRIKRKGGVRYWKMDIQCIDKSGKLENGIAFDEINECGAILSVNATDVVWEKGEFYMVCKSCKRKINVSNSIPQFVQAAIAHQEIVNCL